MTLAAPSAGSSIAAGDTATVGLPMLAQRGNIFGSQAHGHAALPGAGVARGPTL